MIKCGIKGVVEAGRKVDQICAAYGSSKSDVLYGGRSSVVSRRPGSYDERYDQMLRAEPKNNFRESNSNVPPTNSYSVGTQEGQGQPQGRGGKTVRGAHRKHIFLRAGN